MIDIPVNAEVECYDGYAGHCTHVIVNPISKRITHLVVKSARPPLREYMVPMDQVEGTNPRLISLKCSVDELEEMQRFILAEYLNTRVPDYERWRDGYLAWPMVLPAAGYYEYSNTLVAVEHENIPAGELPVHRGAKVEATDGPVGQVDELLVDSASMRIMHLIMRERHVFMEREVAIPVSQIDHVEEDRIYLKLDRKGVEELPTIPVERWAMQVFVQNGPSDR